MAFKTAEADAVAEWDESVVPIHSGVSAPSILVALARYAALQVMEPADAPALPLALFRMIATRWTHHERETMRVAGPARCQ